MSACRPTKRQDSKVQTEWSCNRTTRPGEDDLFGVRLSWEAADDESLLNRIVHGLDSKFTLGPNKSLSPSRFA
jgi:hypothetical protein